jgi:hypothetical protein
VLLECAALPLYLDQINEIVSVTGVIAGYCTSPITEPRPTQAPFQ